MHKDGRRDEAVGGIAMQILKFNCRGDRWKVSRAQNEAWSKN
jgi:hypothetical protein